MSTKTGFFVYEDPSARSVAPTETNAFLVQVSCTHRKEPSDRSQPRLTKPGPLGMEFSQTQFRGWQFPESLFGSLGLRCGQVLSREFCFSYCPTVFLLLTQQLETAPPRLLSSFTTSVTEFSKMPSLFTSGYQLSFLEFSIVASVLLCMSTLLFRTTISRPLPFFPENTLCSLWIACVFYSVDIRRLLLASVLHGNYSWERHRNLRTLYLWTRPYLFTSSLKTWLRAEFWMGEHFSSDLASGLNPRVPVLHWEGSGCGSAWLGLRGHLRRQAGALPTARRMLSCAAAPSWLHDEDHWLPDLLLLSLRQTGRVLVCKMYGDFLRGTWLEYWHSCFALLL